MSDPNQWMDLVQLEYILNQGSPQLGAPGSDELKDQGSYLTQLSKLGNQGTDLDTLIMMGGLDPAAYNDVLAPAEAPGFRQMEEWRNSASPYEAYVASGMASGKKPAELIREIQRLFAGEVPESLTPEQAADIVDAVPRRIDFNTGELMDVPDFKYVQDSINDLDRARNSDPSYELIDGQPMTREESAARQAAMDAGFVNMPGETYDPYSLAPAGTFERDQGIARQQQEAMQRYALEQQKYAPIQDEYQRARAADRVVQAGGSLQGAQDLPAESALARQESMDALRDSRPMSEGGVMTVDQLPSSALGVATQFEPPPGDDLFALANEVKKKSPQDVVEASTRAGLRGAQKNKAKADRTKAAKASSKQSKRTKRAEFQNMKSSWASDFAQNDDQMRQAMARQLLQAGYSPFDDEVRARNARNLGY